MPDYRLAMTPWVRDCMRMHLTNPRFAEADFVEAFVNALSANGIRQPSDLMELDPLQFDGRPDPLAPFGSPRGVNISVALFIVVHVAHRINLD